MNTSLDPNFPFPSPPDFLFVHDVKIFTHSGDTVTDERGKWTKDLTYAEPIEVRGYLTNPNQLTDFSAGSSREVVDAVCLVSNDVHVTFADVLSCIDDKLPPNLAGVYDVSSVRSNISHTRVLLTRHTGEWNRYL